MATAHACQLSTTGRSTASHRTRPVHTRLVRRELRKLARSPDASHRMHPERPVLTGLMRREGSKTPSHRTLGTGLTPVRPVHSATPDSTPDTKGHRPVPPRRACGECFLLRNTPATSPNFPPAPNPHSSQPSELHLLSKCANTTKCTPPCASVLAFSQIFTQRS